MSEEYAQPAAIAAPLSVPQPHLPNDAADLKEKLATGVVEVVTPLRLMHKNALGGVRVYAGTTSKVVCVVGNVVDISVPVDVKAKAVHGVVAASQKMLLVTLASPEAVDGDERCKYIQVSWYKRVLVHRCAAPPFAGHTLATIGV